MVTVVFSTRAYNPQHVEHIKKSSGLDNKIQVVEILNNKEFNGGMSLTEAYNKGLALATNDIVVFCHDDITIETKQWGVKLVKMFNKNPEFGIIGVAGSKTMPVSGRWWDEPSKMYGRVQHTHDGKSWLSSYSGDLGNKIEEVVVCDGVFFAIHKDRIKVNFNEEVEGYHFYDVSFTFENHLVGVKVGVTTGIRINHQSIGVTNEAWEENRKIFAEKHFDILPRKIKRTLRKGEKLNVLIGCLSFANLTGSEMYVYELATELVKQGCTVSICAAHGLPLTGMVKRSGIKMYSLQEPPNFKLGDGKWVVTSKDGQEVSQPNNLYQVGMEVFDVIHLNHKPVTEHLMRLYPNTPIICSIHSEVIALEDPIISPQIKKYIAIRPEIKEHIVKNFGIDENLVEVIYNPINDSKFKVTTKTTINKKKQVLFVGTIDYLRKETIQDLINTTKENGQNLVIVGKKNDTYLDEMMMNQPHVTYHQPTPNIETFVNECDETAGILLGRTTIEGWMCGKSGWIYDVDVSGNILSKELHEVPSDVDKFKSSAVVKQIMEEYIKLI